jgi:VWFA-related protein
VSLAVAAIAMVFCSAAQTPPSFGVSVEVVHVDVFVSRGDAAVEGLSSANFQVFDDGVLQKVEVVSQDEAPLHAILLLDTSHSVAGATFAHLKAAGQAFLEGLGERDLATLLTFAYDIELRSGPAAPPAEAAAAIDRASAQGTTAVHDAVFTALKLADPRHGRPVVLLFSDGLDRMSFLSAKKVLQVARESDAAVYVVFLTAGIVDRGPGMQPRSHQPPDFLRDLASETGGRVWTTTAPQELREKFLQILSQLKNRYVLRFEPRGAIRPGWHELEVKLKGRKGKVRARRGYHQPASN